MTLFGEPEWRNHTFSRSLRAIKRVTWEIVMYVRVPSISLSQVLVNKVGLYAHTICALASILHSNPSTHQYIKQLMPIIYECQVCPGTFTATPIASKYSTLFSETTPRFPLLLDSEQSRQKCRDDLSNSRDQLWKVSDFNFKFIIHIDLLVQYH
jgi:hypothetical protein